ncbi:hypothetical protein R5R35_010529 [Gryllus longicercus]|uniref:DIRP domain-containing protein n=1 Tax=Gryllus longicercus TaxID=2509291 RepID=A0AAN9V833_9ORTH
MADQLESESAAALLSFKNGSFGCKSELDCNTMEVDMDEAPILGPAALGLQRVGEEMPPRQPTTQPGLVLNRRGMPARIRKKNRLFFDDDVVNTLLPRSTKRGVRGSPNKKNATTPSKVIQTPIKKQHVPQPTFNQEPPAPATPEQHEAAGPPTSSPDRRVGQRIGMRLRNLLKLPKAHKWVCYEWFYSNIDLPLFDGDNDFMLCLKEALPQLRTRKLTRAEWANIRHMMGKPRRCSQAFFEEERRELERKRTKIRLLQQRKTADVTNCKDLPEEIPLQLVIGTKVTARLRRPQDGLFTGSIDAVDTSNNTYRITFERQGLGTHSVPDYEVLSNEPPETITVSSFAQKFRPRNLSSFMTPPRLLPAHTPRLSDPMVGSGVVGKSKSIPADGMLGGFPVKCLDMVVRLSKILNAKKNKIKILRDMNAEAEKKKSFGGLIAEDFQRRYANTVVELERLNRDLQGYLTSVQKYCQEIAPEPSQAAVLAPAHLQERSQREAKDMVETAIQTKNIVKSKRMVSLITQLTALMLQVKSLSEADRSAYEVKVLQSSMEEIRSQLSPKNQYNFQNSVEIHMQHIQMGLCHSGSFNPLMAQRV